MLRDALDHAVSRGLQPRFAPPQPLLPGITRLLIERYGEDDRKRKSPRELAALMQRLRQARFDWERVSAGDRLDVAWVLWQGPEPPAEQEAFLRAYLGWLETPWRRVQASRVAAAWAAAFDPDFGSIRAVGEWLATRASRLLPPWVGLAAELDIFSPERGPAKLAEAFLAAADSEAAFFARLRMSGSAAAGGLVLAALGAAAALVQGELARKPRLAARLIELSMHRGNFRPDAIGGISPARTKATRVRLAEALLLPWHHEAPPADAKALIVDHLLRHYRDARVTVEGWAGIDPSATALMRDWLKEKTIAAFFQSVRRQPGADPMELQARHDLWRSYLEHVDDAWLIAGTRGVAALAAERLGCGRLVGCPPDDCALLLKINGVTFVETARLGDQRVWRRGNPLAPPLDRRPDHSYWPAALTTGADFSFGYSRRDRGTWPDRLRNFIERHTGISVPQGIKAI